MSRHAPRSLSSLTTRMLVGAVVLATVGAVLVVLALRVQASARAEVVEVLDPTSLGIEQLRSAVLDQETGIRGYALADNPALLEPYLLGRSRETGALERIRDDLAPHSDPEVGRNVDEIDETMARWRAEVAEPIVQARTAATIENVVTSSQPLFDQVRVALDRTDGSIEQQREAARQDLVAATRLLFATLAVVFVSAFVGIAVGARILIRRVIAPVTELNARTSAIATGEYSTELEVHGVAEVEELAASVSAMRDRIRRDLAESEVARARLDRQAEELERSNRDLEQFAYVASHDLQEPLRKVASFCQLLSDRYGEVLDERGQTYVGFAVDGARRMQALISDLLQFSRVGRNTEGFTDVDLDDVLVDATAAQSSAIADSGATLHVDELPTIRGDRTLLAALFGNLIGNALKYRSEAPPVVRVTCDEVDDGWAILVTDNGIGIAPEYADKVFVIFQRLHGREEYEGTGIGLSLCKKIAEFHRGAITVEDRPPGDGARIRVWFPRPDDLDLTPPEHTEHTTMEPT